MRGISVLLFVIGVALARAQVERCPTEQEEDWSIEWLMRHDDCHKFYKCTFGQPIEYTCPSNLYFNLDLWECDWQENVDCDGRNDPADTTTAPPTTLKPTTPEPTTPEPTTPEPTTPEPTTPEPTTPEPTTPEPTTPEPTTPEPTTPEPTTPEPTTPKPTTPEPTTPKPTTPKPTTPKPTTPKPTTTTKEPGCEIEIWPEPELELEPEYLPNGCPVDGHIHKLLPHEEDCSLFYYCVWGELVLSVCPNTLHFNPKIQVCDWPSDAGCAVSVNKHSEARRRLLAQILN